MDFEILRTVINSCDDADDSGESEASNFFPPMNEGIINALSVSLTNHLAFPVNQQMFQRFEIQLQLIKTLQDWAEIKNLRHDFCAFSSGSEILDFTLRILKKYATTRQLQSASSETLERVSRLLLVFCSRDFSLIQILNRAIISLSKTSPNNSTNAFLEFVISRPEITDRATEEIFVSRQSHFVEKPLIDAFAEFLELGKLEKPPGMYSELLKKSAKSSPVFRLACAYLKEIQIAADSESAVDFARFYLNAIGSENPGILDLYPENRQAFSIFMSLEPNLLSPDSKNRILEAANELFLKSSTDLLILVSHFPDWLSEIANFIDESKSNVMNHSMEF